MQGVVIKWLKYLIEVADADKIVKLPSAVAERVHGHTASLF